MLKSKYFLSKNLWLTIGALTILSIGFGAWQVLKQKPAKPDLFQSPTLEVSEQAKAQFLTQSGVKILWPEDFRFRFDRINQSTQLLAGYSETRNISLTLIALPHAPSPEDMQFIEEDILGFSTSEFDEIESDLTPKSPDIRLLKIYAHEYTDNLVFASHLVVEKRDQHLFIIIRGEPSFVHSNLSMGEDLVESMTTESASAQFLFNDVRVNNPDYVKLFSSRIWSFWQAHFSQDFQKISAGDRIILNDFFSTNDKFNLELSNGARLRTFGFGEILFKDRTADQALFVVSTDTESLVWLELKKNMKNLSGEDFFNKNQVHALGYWLWLGSKMRDVLVFNQGEKSGVIWSLDEKKPVGSIELGIEVEPLELMSEQFSQIDKYERKDIKFSLVRVNYYEKARLHPSLYNMYEKFSKGFNVSPGLAQYKTLGNYFIFYP